MEALDPESKGKTTPSTNAIPSPLPKEDGDSATCDSSDGASKNEHSTKSLVWRIDGRDDTEFKNEDKTDKRKGIEADEKERSPMRE